MNALRQIMQFLTLFVAASASVAFVLFAAAMFWLSLQLDQPRELELLATLFITMAMVIAAAFITALLHRLIGRRSATETGTVFRESIKRYAWIAAPIASGYGLAQIVRTVAEIIAQTP